MSLRKWPWKELPVYNGFTHEERIRGWQLGQWMQANGLRTKPVRCCISGSDQRVGFHSENYYDWQPYALNQQIHLALHRRFNSPAAWRAIVDRYASTGDEWFARLSEEPSDLAGSLRAEHGVQIADLFGRASQRFLAFASFLAENERT